MNKLQKEFEKETGVNVCDSSGKTFRIYIKWLENEIEENKELIQEIISELEDIQSDYYSSQQTTKTNESYDRAVYLPEGIETAIKVINKYIKKEKNNDITRRI